MTKEELIKKLELLPHPEGGYYKETYRSKELINEVHLPDSYQGNRNVSTCIYFLITSDNFSAFHRINQEEIWHFYLGAPILLHTISEEGTYQKFTIGNDFNKGQTPQLIVPGGDWFAAEIVEKEGFALVGCTVAPGFDFTDFELAKQSQLIEKFPQHQKIISRFTRS